MTEPELRRLLESRTTLLEKVRTERDAAEARAGQLELIVAALIRKHGEEVMPGYSWRVPLTESELIGDSGAILRIMRDPNSGAMLLRYELPL